MQKPVVRDGVIKYVWSTGDAGAGSVGAEGVSTYTVNYEVDPEGSARSCQGIRTFF